MRASGFANDKGHDAVKILLEKGADLHVRSEQGSTALTYALMFGNYEVVKTLLNQPGIEQSINAVLTAMNQNLKKKNNILP